MHFYGFLFDFQNSPADQIFKILLNAFQLIDPDHDGTLPTVDFLKSVEDETSTFSLALQQFFQLSDDVLDVEVGGKIYNQHDNCSAALTNNPISR